MEIASKYKPAEQQACADKLTKWISRLVRKSIKDLNMILHGDQAMICMSGGKLQDKDLYAPADYKKFPIIPYNLCSSQKNLQRYKVKKLIAERGKSDPNVIKSMFHALSNVIPSHLLDIKMFDLSMNKFYEIYN